MGAAPAANPVLIDKEVADKAMDAAVCIGCNACVATCKNAASAALFTAARIKHLNSLHQGKPEASRRNLDMTRQMELEGFGSRSFTGACEVECPACISAANIAEMPRAPLMGCWIGS